MGAIVRIKFAKNAFEVILNRVFRNVEIRRDDLVGTAVCHPMKDVELARRDRVVRRVLGDMSATIQFTGSPKSENRPCKMTKSLSAITVPDPYLSVAGRRLMRLNKPSRPGGI